MNLKKFETQKGDRIMQIPLRLFPGLDGYVYLVLASEGDVDYRVLIDSGSGFGECDEQLQAGLQFASGQTGESLYLQDLTHILITHGHIDHFGGLSNIHAQTNAIIAIHELDLRNVTNYEERFTVASNRLDSFLVEAGVNDEVRSYLIDLYKVTKSLHQSVPVDLTYEAQKMRIGPFEMLHVPGHCAGHVVIRLHDILFTGDHVLSHISPHQSPEHLTLSTGLEHYLNSLEKLFPWTNGVRLSLGGHGEPIADLPQRVEEIKKVHTVRLQEVLGYFVEPHTIAELSAHLFGEVDGYHALLALEEAGAHVEYLYQRGFLGIDNLEEMKKYKRSIPIKYICIPCFHED
jgi:glyoxylase-like metal-dependent hydrolase (beta-lactamase superfamily II)